MNKDTHTHTHREKKKCTQKQTQKQTDRRTDTRAQRILHSTHRTIARCKPVTNDTDIADIDEITDITEIGSPAVLKKKSDRSDRFSIRFQPSE